jgi:glyoxylase-like metal-dependent hydrolase (beta-lactamase superfamily II)
VNRGASSTVTLIQSDDGRNIIVDTGDPSDRHTIVESLREAGLTPGDIDIVVNTHAHGDHTGNNDLFDHAIVVEPKEGLKLKEDIQIIYTPGHTLDSYSVLVSTARGTIAIVGDLISLESDLSSGRVPYSIDFPLQKENRERVLGMAQYIVPGHDGMFKVRNKAG